MTLQAGTAFGPYEILAALNHPNIATIFGLEEIGSTGSGQAVLALAMELMTHDERRTSNLERRDRGQMGREP